ncbi:MAG: hypothetical protein Q9187_009454, partial [Circinaria calcarea]
QFNKLDIESLQSSNSTATSLTPPACNSSLISSPNFYNRFDVPSLPPGGQDLINNGIENPNNGRLVEITQRNVPMTIYSSNGAEIKGLSISPLPNDQSNTPGGQDTSGGATPSSSGGSTSTSATAAATTTAKEGLAGRTEVK